MLAPSSRTPLWPCSHIDAGPLHCRSPPSFHRARSQTIGGAQQVGRASYCATDSLVNHLAPLLPLSHPVPLSRLRGSRRHGPQSSRVSPSPAHVVDLVQARLGPRSSRVSEREMFHWAISILFWGLNAQHIVLD
jgi:hypothetical protein